MCEASPTAGLPQACQALQSVGHSEHFLSENLALRQQGVYVLSLLPWHCLGAADKLCYVLSNTTPMPGPFVCLLMLLLLLRWSSVAQVGFLIPHIGHDPPVSPPKC